jgi:putative transposase
MVRPLRIVFPGAVYHITSRGNERKAIFRDDEDREFFLESLNRVRLRYHWLCHAYCLMDNHYHLLIETPDGNLSLGMRQLNGIYTQLFNRRHQRVGHLFQGRFKAVVVQKDSHLLEACRYVVLNPVRARMVERLHLWKWSSYSATAGLQMAPSWLTIDWVLSQWALDKKSAQKAYRKFVNDGRGAEPLWKEVRAQSILGEDNFVESMGNYVKGKENIPEISKSQRFVNRPTLETLFTEATGRDREIRNRRIAEAVERYGYMQKEVADHLKLHFASVSRILRTKNEMLRK